MKRKQRRDPVTEYDQVFSVLKATEGGPGGKTTIDQLKAVGIKATQELSSLVGHTAIRVHSNSRRVLARAERIIWG